jgi:hypothetical protein
MRKSRFSETQIVEILKEGKAGMPVADHQGRQLSAEGEEQAGLLGRKPKSAEPEEVGVQA